MKNVSDKVCTENQDTRFMSGKCFSKSCRLWDNAEKYASVRQVTDGYIIRRMRIACRTIKAKIHTHKNS